MSDPKESGAKKLAALLLDETSSLEELREQEKKCRSEHGSNLFTFWWAVAIFVMSFVAAAVIIAVTSDMDSKDWYGFFMICIIALNCGVFTAYLSRGSGESIGRSDLAQELIDEIIKTKHADVEESSSAQP